MVALCHRFAGWCQNGFHVSLQLRETHQGTLFNATSQAQSCMEENICKSDKNRPSDEYAYWIPRCDWHQSTGCRNYNIHYIERLQSEENKESFGEEGVVCTTKPQFMSQEMMEMMTLMTDNVLVSVAHQQSTTRYRKRDAVY